MMASRSSKPMAPLRSAPSPVIVVMSSSLPVCSSGLNAEANVWLGSFSRFTEWVQIGFVDGAIAGAYDRGRETPSGGHGMVIKQLLYLAALGRERHFGRAAKSCNISQPSLSAAIRQLEEELGVEIVERGHRFRGFT